MQIEHHYVAVSARLQHYLAAGDGPPVVLLHQSPRTALDNIEMIARLAGRARVIAPDTPGFGLSDALDVDPLRDDLIDDFAHAAAAFLDALGLDRVPVYGFHTGASIATRLARLYPARVSALVAHGTLVLNPEERADFLTHYLPPFAPAFDGAHLISAWARMRDQAIFFPWYRREARARLPGPPRSPEAIHPQVMDFFAAGDAYRAGYRAALSYDARGDIPAIAPPALYLGAAPDPLTAGLDAFPPLPAGAKIQRAETYPAAFGAAAAFLLAHAAGAAPALHPQASARAFVGGPDFPIHVRRFGLSGAPRLALVHALGEGAASLALYAAALEGKVEGLIIDLPGHGQSAPRPGGLDALADALTATFAAESGPPWRAAGFGSGGAVLARAAARRPDLFAALDQIGPAAWLPPPNLTPDAEGAHLLKAWRYVRDRRLFGPWPALSAPTADMGDFSPAQLHAETVDVLRAQISDALAAELALEAPQTVATRYASAAEWLANMAGSAAIP